MYNPRFKGDVCSHKNAFVLDNVFRRLVQNPEKITAPYILPGDTVVDLGCGPGFFSLAMARLVGNGGKVIAVDLQKEMLEKVMKKAGENNLDQVIHPHVCTQEAIGLPRATRAQFILAYYMVHETPDPGRFFAQAKSILAPEGRILVVEPPFHVGAKQFAGITSQALDAGLTILDRPKGKGGKALVLGKNQTDK